MVYVNCKKLKYKFENYNYINKNKFDIMHLKQFHYFLIHRLYVLFLHCSHIDIYYNRVKGVGH